MADSKAYLTFLCFIALYFICICGSKGNVEEAKRLSNPLHRYALQQLARNNVMTAIADTLSARVRRGHHHMTDAGYGSRVQAASKMANALIAHHDVYGAYGPGKKRKRTNISSRTLRDTRSISSATQK